jgi:hypothetical protein
MKIAEIQQKIENRQPYNTLHHLNTTLPHTFNQRSKLD